MSDRRVALFRFKEAGEEVVFWSKGWDWGKFGKGESRESWMRKMQFRRFRKDGYTYMGWYAP